VNTTRPVPGWEAPPGTVHEPMPATNWRLVVGEKRCRLLTGKRTACGVPAVAETNRSQDHTIERWWAYCADHMFGRWIEDGQVWQWRVVPIDSEESV
jgi:hypothetical protein